MSERPLATISRRSASHTPGPWKVYVVRREDKQLGSYVAQLDVTDSQNRTLFGVHLRPYTFDHAESNARLIAAAPEMYSVLQEVEGLLGELPYDELADEILCKVENALAKAVGGGV